MNEVSLQPVTSCRYVSRLDGCKCQLPVWEGSGHGLCLGHAKELDKPKSAFLQLIRYKLRRKDYSFDGFVFPTHLHLKNFTFNEPVSFYDCTFHRGILFESIRFKSGLISFENSSFLGKTALFQKCDFEAEKNLFTGSRSDVNCMVFNHCRFAGDLTDFTKIRWQGRRALAFLKCFFDSRETSFVSAGLNAPVISFGQTFFGSDRFQIGKSVFRAGLCTFRRLRQTRGALNFEETFFDCKQLDLSDANWSGDTFTIRKCIWKGDVLSFVRGRANTDSWDFHNSLFEGKAIDLTDFESTDSPLSFTKIRFHALESIFTNLKAGRDLSFNQCNFKGNLVLMNGWVTEGSLLKFHNNRVEAERFSMRDSILKTKRVSFCRSRFHVKHCDFSHCDFSNTHTSFKAIDVQGETASFNQSRMISKQTSFNLSRFGVDRLLFDGVDFGDGRVSFWKTDFTTADVSFRKAFNGNGEIKFDTDVSNIRFEGALLMTDCDFNGARWSKTGLLKRFCTADERNLLSKYRYEQLHQIYQWIAEQYSRKGNKVMEANFLYSCREVERLKFYYSGLPVDKLKMELRRWITGYELGFSLLGPIKGLASLLIACSLYMARLKQFGSS